MKRPLLSSFACWLASLAVFTPRIAPAAEIPPLDQRAA